MTKLTAREVQVIAHYRFPARLDAVLTAAINYQHALLAVRRAEDADAEATETHEIALTLQSDLPDGLDLLSIAQRQLDEARTRLPRARQDVARKGEALFDAGGPAAQTVLGILEQHHFDIARDVLERELTGPVPIA